jgi:hypothetical protein
MYTSNTPGLFGSGDFTIEFYAYPLSDDSNQFITNVSSGANNRSWSFDMGVNNNLTFTVYRSTSGSTELTAGINTINENEWTHVCAMRRGTGLYLFRNGVLMDQDTIGASETVYENGVTPTTDLYIGRRPGSLTHYNGYIDNYRLTKSARYPITGFAAPTEFPNDVQKDAGLFSRIGNGALIEDVGITNANISGVVDSLYKGILAGSAQGPSSDDGGAVTVRNSYVEGTVDSGGDLAGGLIGHTGANASSIFENTYADVTVTGGGTRTGGWVGFYESDGTAVENYWNTDKTVVGWGGGGDTPGATEVSGLTTAQLNAEANYTGWDFTDTWEIDEGVSPATLQTARPYEASPANIGACDDQWELTWREPTNIGVFLRNPAYMYVGAYIEEYSSGSWTNLRYIPRSRAAALMTPDVPHRITTIWEQYLTKSRFRLAGTERNISNGMFRPNKEIQIRNPGNYTSKNTSDSRGPYGSTAMRYTGGSKGGYSLTSITISNPSIISMQENEPVNFVGGATSGSNVTFLLRLEALPMVAEDTTTGLVGGSLGAHDPSTLDIDRVNGASIG